MASEMLGAWLERQLLLRGGLTRRGVADGWLLTGGLFWVRTAGGCLLYRGVGSEAAIDFDRPVGAAAHDAVEIREFPWIAAGAAGSCWYAVRTVSADGTESVGATVIRVELDAAGALVGGRPGAVERVWAQPAGAGRLRLAWRYSPATEVDRPEGFRIYHDNGTGVMDLSAPAGEVAWDGHRVVYGWTSGAYAAGQRVRLRVCAVSAAGEGEACDVEATVDGPLAGWPAVMSVDVLDASEVPDGA